MFGELTTAYCKFNHTCREYRRELEETRAMSAKTKKIPPMPPVEPRDPLRSIFDDGPTGYDESLRDWADHNWEAVEWFLENAEAIREMIDRAGRLKAIIAELVAAGENALHVLTPARPVMDGLDRTRMYLREAIAKAKKP
jgi:hypothetical protein